MKTTYQITAETMIQKHGAAEALAMAQSFTRKPYDLTVRGFWHFVAVCIAQENAKAA